MVFAIILGIFGIVVALIQGIMTLWYARTTKDTSERNVFYSVSVLAGLIIILFIVLMLLAHRGGKGGKLGALETGLEMA